MAATVSICLSLWVSDIQGCWLNLLILSILDVEYVLVCVFSLRTSRSRCWKGSSTACWGSGKGESSSLTHLPFQTAYFVMYLQNVIFYLILCGFKLKLDNFVIWICRIKFCLCVLGKATRSQTDMILLCFVFRPRTKDDLRAYFILVQVRKSLRDSTDSRRARLCYLLCLLLFCSFLHRWALCCWHAQIVFISLFLLDFSASSVVEQAA